MFARHYYFLMEDNEIDTCSSFQQMLRMKPDPAINYVLSIIVICDNNQMTFLPWPHRVIMIRSHRMGHGHYGKTSVMDFSHVFYDGNT